jgi:hypothetical protein
MTHNPSVERTMKERLPNWRDGAASYAITNLVARMGSVGSSEFIPARFLSARCIPRQRITLLSVRFRKFEIQRRSRGCSNT